MTTAPTPKTHGSPHASTSPTQKTHGNPHTTTTTTAKAHGNPHTSTTTTTKAHGNPRKSTTTPTGSTTPTSTTTTLNPIAQKLQNKPLGTRIEHMLPTGMTLNTASEGFRNQGQFIAAVHVSQNLGIPFADLKATMLGKPVPGATVTPTSSHSLGQSIQLLKPGANAGTETTRAQTQVSADLKVKRPRG